MYSELDYLERLQRLPWYELNKVKDAHVLVVGVGALGNELLKLLAQMGIGHIYFIDHDVVEYSNISRSVLFKKDDVGKRKVEVAARELLHINPHINVYPIFGDAEYDLGLGLIARMDAIVCGLDNRRTRRSINRNCFSVGKPWVDGGIEDLAGYVQTYMPGISCYESGLTDVEKEFIDVQYGCMDSVKKKLSQGQVPTTPIIASFTAALQINEVMKLIHRHEDTLLPNHVSRFNLARMSFGTYMTEEPDPACTSSTERDANIDPAVVKEIHSGLTVKEFLSFLEKKANSTEIGFVLKSPFVTLAEAKNKQKNLNSPRHQVEDMLFNQQGEDDDFIENLTWDLTLIKQVDKDFPFQEMTLKEIGVAPLDRLEIETSEGVYLVELSGDLNKFNFNTD